MLKRKAFFLILISLILALFIVSCGGKSNIKTSPKQTEDVTDTTPSNNETTGPDVTPSETEDIDNTQDPDTTEDPDSTPGLTGTDSGSGTTTTPKPSGGGTNTPTPKPTGQGTAKLSDNIVFTNSLANKVQGYFANPARSSYTMTNTQVVINHNLTASGNKNVTSFKTTDGKVYLNDTMDVFIEDSSGNTYYASKSKTKGSMNTIRLGYYYYESHIRDLGFATQNASKTLPIVLDRTFHIYSDKLHQELRIIATDSVSGIKEIGSEIRIAKNTVSKIQFKDRYGVSSNFSSIDGRTCEYLAFDVKNVGVFGIIFPSDNKTKRVVLTEEGNYYVFKQYANFGFSSLQKEGDFSFSSRIYTDKTHSFTGIEKEAYLERNPMTGIEVTDGNYAKFIAYDHTRGAYRFTMDGNTFNGAYYHTPDKHYFADIKITSDNNDRKIYIWMNTMSQFLEGAAILDDSKLLMPIPMQVGKNFAGDEKPSIYLPNDNAAGFGDTLFPLSLKAKTTTKFTLLNLYQNWGKFPLKQISSIQFHISYYHLSTGVTESNCIAPYFVYDKDGWTLPDFRGASGIMWSDQPQFNSVGRLYFVSYLSGNTKYLSEYTDGKIHSSGLTYADIDYSYISDCGSYKYTLRHVEFPQLDENRTYYSLRLEFIKDLTITDARNNLSLFSFDGRFTYFKQIGYLDANNVMQKKTNSTTNGAKEIITLGKNYPYFSYFDLHNGEEIMNFGFILKNSHITIGGQTYTGNFAVKNEFKGGLFQTRLNVGTFTLDTGTVNFKKGDKINLDFILLPYGTHNDKHDNNVRTVREDSAINPLKIEAIRGSVIADTFLPRIKATGNKAEFKISGGRNNNVVRIDGFTKLNKPTVYEYVNNAWKVYNISHHSYDGYTVHYNSDGTYGFSFVFNMTSPSQTRTFKIEN